MTEIIGWVSSAILVLTISTQVLRQWRSGTSKGVSTWLFVGQFVASTGFCVYSVLLHNSVFIATNGLMAVAALVGLAIVRIHRRREARPAQARTARSASASAGPVAEAPGSAPAARPAGR